MRVLYAGELDLVHNQFRYLWSVKQHEHHLEDRAAAHIPFLHDRFHHFLERKFLVTKGLQRTQALFLEKILKGRGGI